MYLSCVYFSSYWLLSDLPSPIPSEGDNRYSASGEKGKFSLKFALGKGRISEAPPPPHGSGEGGRGRGHGARAGLKVTGGSACGFAASLPEEEVPDES